MSRLVMHVDLDAFFAAVEQRDHPEWRGLPLVVGVEPAVLKDTLRWAAQEVGYLVRHEHRKGLVVTLKIRFRPFETHTRSRTLKAPTANDLEIFRVAWALFQTESWTGRPVRLIGIGLSGWDEAQLGEQQDLFDESMPEPHPAQERPDWSW